MSTSLQVTLESLADGETARIVDYCGDEECANRLSEVGLRIGVSVRMVKQGSPCIVAIGEQRLCYRPHDDCTVIVELN